MKQTLWRGQLRLDEPMAEHCSWRAGGRAKRFYKPVDLADLQLFLAELPPQEALLWIGLGSNLLVRDGGFNGTVILSTPSLKEMRLVGVNKIYAQAGVPCAKLARFCAQHNLTGGEFFAGIPGTVGGALAMNAGAFGGETWPVVDKVDMLDRRGRLKQRSTDEFKIGYRSVQGPADEWFAAAVFVLQPGDGEKSSQTMRELLKKRAATQPTQFANAGSVFRNPPGTYAAKLIEQCGLKGHRIGGAQVSTMHANFIINLGGATAADIESLIRVVVEAVKKQTGIGLETEVRIVGVAEEQA